MDGEADEPLGSEAGCVAEVGGLTVGVVTDTVGTVGTVGVLTDGVVTLGVVTCGVETVPTPTDGTVTDGTVTGGIVTDGSVAVAVVTDGSVAVAVVTDGTVTGSPDVREDVVVGTVIASAPDVPAGVAPASSIRDAARMVRTERLMWQGPALGRQWTDQRRKASANYPVSAPALS